MSVPRAIALAVGLVLLASPALAQNRPQLFEIISREPYRGSWNRMIAPVLKNDRWLKGARGVWAPVQPITVNGVRFNVYVLCQPAGCAQGKISALFEAGGSRAYGAFRNAAGTQILGSPAETERRALLIALH